MKRRNDDGMPAAAQLVLGAGVGFALYQLLGWAGGFGFGSAARGKREGEGNQGRGEAAGPAGPAPGPTLPRGKRAHTIEIDAAKVTVDHKPMSLEQAIATIATYDPDRDTAILFVDGTAMSGDVDDLADALYKSLHDGWSRHGGAPRPRGECEARILAFPVKGHTWAVKYNYPFSVTPYEYMGLQDAVAYCKKRSRAKLIVETGSKADEAAAFRRAMLAERVEVEETPSASSFGGTGRLPFTR